jgi:hypothetical protein
MNVFIQAVSRVLKGSVKAFQTFPAAIANAFAFAIVTMMRIQLDWPEQEAYNFLFNCLHWSFALGAVFSLAAITGAKSRFNQAKATLLANLLGIGVALVTFLVLYGLSVYQPTGARFAVVSSLATYRVGVALLVSFITFIYLAGYPKDQSDFSRSLFMTQKAFFVAVLYGLVLMAGTSGVAGAIEALLYTDMSGKVYSYLGTLSGFLAFTIFLGYFPDFRKGEIDERREVAQKHPRFISILFDYIMIPILLALTVVLLLWAVRTVLSGMGVSFLQLSGIATAYTAYGIWLHIMVTHYETGIARFYRRIYPLTALVILGFEAWALFIQLQKSGLKTTEYFFIIIWFITLIAALLLFLRKDKAHTAIAVITCVMAILTAFPIMGYQALPVSAQVSRLEKLLVNQNMLKDNQLVPATTEPEKAVRESITDAVNFLAYMENAKLPPWFDRDLRESGTFKNKLGFEPIWPQMEEPFGKGSESLVTALVMRPEPIDISPYHWTIDLQQFAEYNKGQSGVLLKGEKGSYRIYWSTDMTTGIPNLKIQFNDRVILDDHMDAFIDRISKAYPPNQGQPTPVSAKEMSLQLETPEVSVLVLFRNVDIRLDPRRDVINYWLNASVLYLREKP